MPRSHKILLAAAVALSAVQPSLAQTPPATDAPSTADGQPAKQHHHHHKQQDNPSTDSSTSAPK